MRIDGDNSNSPRLAAVLGDHVARGARRAFCLDVVGVSLVHDDGGVEVAVGGRSAARCRLALDGGAPALGLAAVGGELGDDFAVERHGLVVFGCCIVVLV